MRRGAAAAIGVVVGAAVGGLLLVTTHPTSAYLNDAYREGASFGFVMRYAALGLLAGLLVHVVASGRRRGLAVAGLAVVAAVAVVPPVLDDESPSERRRAAAVAEDDPARRYAAEVRAGAIDGCARRSRRDLEGTPQEGRLDPDAYCTCFIDAVLAGPADDEAQLRAMRRALLARRPTPALLRAGARCQRVARRG